MVLGHEVHWSAEIMQVEQGDLQVVHAEFTATWVLSQVETQVLETLSRGLAAGQAVQLVLLTEHAAQLELQVWQAKLLVAN